jgi:hypothetical protein
MGNAHVNSGATSQPESKSDTVTPPYSATKHATSVEYFVQPFRETPGVPEHLIFRLDPEAAVVLDATTGTVLKIWPYHLVLCWGFTESTFQLKAFLPGTEDASDSPRVLIHTASLRNIKVPEGSAEIEAVVMTTKQARGLLSEIKQRGLPEDRFSSLLASLDELEVRAVYTQGLKRQC